MRLPLSQKEAGGGCIAGPQSCNAGRPVGVVIHLEANSLIQARLKAGVAGDDANAPFAEGHEARRPPDGAEFRRRRSGGWLEGRHRAQTAPRLRLDQQSNEADKQRAPKDHGPVPDVETDKPAVGRHKFELHERPLLGICSQSSLG
jgi:hypothetical protein